MKKKITVATLTLAAILTIQGSAFTTPALVSAAEQEETQTETDTRPRTIITTDLECDDIDSLLHMLLYANDIDIDGLVVSSSQHHWTGDGEHTMDEVIDSYIQNGDLTEWRPMDVNYIHDTISNEYAAVYPNLIKNDPAYPSPDDLLSVTKIGNVEFEGDYRTPTEGSDLIKSCLLDDDMRTLYLQAWGGTNTIARALLSIEEEYKDSKDWDSVYEKICSKAVLISWGDQDNAYPDYIAVNWPDIGRLYCLTNGVGYNSSNTATVPYRQYFKADWLKENIKFNHGALMDKYLLFGDGTYYEGETPSNQFGDMASLSMEDCWLSWFGGADAFEQYDYISEGDSPCWMYIIPVGLRGLENSEYGSWGGRISTEDHQAISEYDPTLGQISSGYSLQRWLPAFMNDWAARADWCVSEYEDANHQPVVTSETEDMKVTAGDTIQLKGSATDPDGDELNENWYIYSDASSYSGEGSTNLDVWEHGVNETSFTVPLDAQVGDVFNLVYEVTDNGAPALTRYAQVIITVANAAPEAEAEEK